MSNVVPLLRCKRCGAAGNPCTLEYKDEAIAGFVACDSCVKECSNTMLRVRPIFDAMIAAGIPNDVANDTMTFLLEKAKL